MVDLDKLLEQLGPAATPKVTERLRRFAYLLPRQIERLATEALPEEWGNDRFVLIKYLAVHVAWSIEQQHYTKSDGQLYISAGHLQTRYGTPLYLVFEPNEQQDRQPWALVSAGS